MAEHVASTDVAPSDDEFLAVQRLLSRERLSIDTCEPGRTCFLSHAGAQAKLKPAPWIAHRNLIEALTKAPLPVPLQTSLSRAVLIEHGRDFGVGRLELTGHSSGLPFGGTSLRLRHRRGGPTCLSVWGLGATAVTARCDWLLLRAMPQWSLTAAVPPLRPASVEVLAALGGEVIVAVANPTDASLVATACAKHLSLCVHSRFAPYVGGPNPDAPVRLWPHDAFRLSRRPTQSTKTTTKAQAPVSAVVLVSASSLVRQQVERWCAAQGPRGERIQIVEVGCPGYADTDQLGAFWQECGRPRVLLRGDPRWVRETTRVLESLQAAIAQQTDATQLDLL